MNSESKEILDCFVLFYFALWLVQKTHIILSTNQMQNYNQSHRLVTRVFPRFYSAFPIGSSFPLSFECECDHLFVTQSKSKQTEAWENATDQVAFGA